jgi:hypothetical protein
MRGSQDHVGLLWLVGLVWPAINAINTKPAYPRVSCFRDAVESVNRCGADSAARRWRMWPAARRRWRIGAAATAGG